MKTLANLWARTEWKMFVSRGNIFYLLQKLYVILVEFEVEPHPFSLIRNYKQVKVDMRQIVCKF